MDIQEALNAINNKSTFMKYALNKEFRAYVEDKTSFLDVLGKVPLKFRCIVLNMGLDANSYPKCPHCQNLCSFDKAHHDTINKFCSDACSKAYGRTSDDSRNKLNDKEWLVQKRLTENLSYESIGKLLGISVNPVKKACVKFGILKKETSLSTVVELYESGMSMTEVGDVVGKSKSVISVMLADTDTIIREANSYERKFNKRSAQEIELESFIQSLGFVTENSRRKLLGGLEIDIFIPEKNIGFEYNGVAYHCETDHLGRLQKDKKYHLNKTIKAEDAGIKLFHIFSDDWLLNREVTKSVIAAKLGIYDRKIFARKCEIVKVGMLNRMVFLNGNHLQGVDNSSLAYGLKIDGELVSLMTFCKSRYNRKYDWELSRFVSLKNTLVIGGFSKLLKYFRKNHSGSIISYANRSISDGGVYAKNGFEMIKKNPPSYWYINLRNSEKRLHRAAFMKSRIKTDANDKRSEREIMLEKGYRRIWDCGTIAYGLK